MRIVDPVVRRARISTAAVLLCGTTLLGLAIPLAHAQDATNPDALDLNAKQLAAIKIETLTTRSFPVETRAVGAVDFNEDMSVQVFPHYQGKIASAFAALGDEVKQGQPLYTINSPDLVQAEGTLIETAATLQLTNAALARARAVFAEHGIAQKDLDQAISDQANAEGALKAARDAVLVFGKTSAEIDNIIASRKIDPRLVVPSPITGRVTARNAQPGLFVQPGNSPAPYNVADLSVMWINANVAESDAPKLRIGQATKVSVAAYPNRVFTGKIDRLGTAVDPNVHTLVARTEIADPHHELRPGMIATFLVEIAAPQVSVAIPFNGVVREGDGTMTAWVTTDQKHYVRKIITIGTQQEGYRQVLDGLKPGEQVVSTGAILLDNLAAGVSADD